MNTKVNIQRAERIFNDAIKLLNSDCPHESCEWCSGVKWGEKS